MFVFVAESTLENFANIGEHHQADYGYLGCMFTPASRPESLRILYRYEINPVATNLCRNRLIASVLIAPNKWIVRVNIINVKNDYISHTRFVFIFISRFN